VSLLVSAGHEVHAPTLTGTGDRAHLGNPETGLVDHVADVQAVLELVHLDSSVTWPGQSVIDALPPARAEHFLRLVDERGRIVLDPDSAMDGWAVTETRGPGLAGAAPARAPGARAQRPATR